MGGNTVLSVTRAYSRATYLLTKRSFFQRPLVMKPEACLRLITRMQPNFELGKI